MKSGTASKETRSAKRSRNHRKLLHHLSKHQRLIAVAVAVVVVVVEVVVVVVEDVLAIRLSNNFCAACLGGVHAVTEWAASPF